MTSLNLDEIVVASTGLTVASTAYTDGDILGAEMTFLLPSSATRAIVISASLVDKADITGAVDLFLFDRAVTFGTDNAAPSISDADLLFNLGIIEFPYPKDVGGARLTTIDSLALVVKANASSNIYGRLVTRSGHTFFGAAGDLQVRLAISKDV